MKKINYWNRNPGSALMNYPLVLTLACLLATGIALASEEPKVHHKDPHYNEAGFFDIHVCNWPDRKQFFMPLFSTEHPDAIRNIEILTPENKPLLQLDLKRYRTIKRKDKPDKRAIINQIDIPQDAADGWYTARINLHDGRVLVAKDYVVITRLAQARGQDPANGTEVSLPDALRWEPVPGASFYQVFIRDLWNDDELIYTSKLLDSPELVLPPGLLKPGGYYSWIVHSRDTNEDAMLGDFNHGSMSRASTFSVLD